MKTDASGDTLWTKTYGRPDNDRDNTIIPTHNGDYLIGATMTSFDPSGRYDIWLIKIDSLGNTIWARVYGGDGYGWLSSSESVIESDDNGYIIVGTTTSFGAGARDIYLIKTDSIGNIQWTKTFGGLEFDDGWLVQQTADGGYIIAGMTNSFGAGNTDAYLIKTDENGDTIWTRTYGGSDWDDVRTVLQTPCGGIYSLVIPNHSAMDAMFM
uniref:Bulb-type lectin domain-containing protein n=1 Tax=candidate division WOR-3 bacterium TaxID=2052148 RepID=A0A7V0Z611_UNCW3